MYLELYNLNRSVALGVQAACQCLNVFKMYVSGNGRLLAIEFTQKSTSYDELSYGYIQLELHFPLHAEGNISVALAPLQSLAHFSIRVSIL